MLTIEPRARVRPVLVLAVGNPSRGDDALGPMLAGRLEALGRPDVEVLTDFQLQVEHALDMIGRRAVIFVDASADGPAPYSWLGVCARAGSSATTHALSPGEVLGCYQRVVGDPPPSLVLAIRGGAFELGAPLSDAARANLDCALAALVERIDSL
ncbi:MAG: hydrogenase maturation protease [Gemmatimonadota bacterium]